MNYHGFYFGAYIEVATKRIKKLAKRNECDNGHERRFFTKFCPECGAPVTTKDVYVEAFPECFHGILPAEFEGSIGLSGPNHLPKTGVLIAVPEDSEKGLWLRISHHKNVFDRTYGLTDTKPFPTDQEVDNLIDEVEKEYADVIECLHSSPAVQSVNIRCGLIVDRP